jgi:hypothetical protein
VTQVSQFKPHVSVSLGAAQPEGSGITASEFGAEVGYQPYIPFGAAIELNHSRIDDGDKAVDRNTVWLKATYNFGGTQAILNQSYIGLGAGTVFRSDGTSLALAPLAGFDIPIGKNTEGVFTLGANMRYAVVSDNEVDTLSLAGVLKYWY